MIRKSILSILGGVIFASILAFAVPAKAGCLGLCPDRIGDYWYAGCTIVINGDTGEAYVNCYYTHVTPIQEPNIAD